MSLTFNSIQNQIFINKITEAIFLEDFEKSFELINKNGPSLFANTAPYIKANIVNPELVISEFPLGFLITQSSFSNSEKFKLLNSFEDINGTAQQQTQLIQNLIELDNVDIFNWILENFHYNILTSPQMLTNKEGIQIPNCWYLFYKKIKTNILNHILENPDNKNYQLILQSLNYSFENKEKKPHSNNNTLSQFFIAGTIYYMSKLLDLAPLTPEQLNSTDAKSRTPKKTIIKNIEKFKNISDIIKIDKKDQKALSMILKSKLLYPREKIEFIKTFNFDSELVLKEIKDMTDNDNFKTLMQELFLTYLLEKKPTKQKTIKL